MPAHLSNRTTLSNRTSPVSLVLVAFTATCMLACAAPVASPSPPASPAAPGSTTPAAVTPGTEEPLEVSLPELVADGASFDGRRVIVSGSYVGTPQRQVLCELLLESYPPQAGGAMIELSGQLPQDILDRLESTADEPGLAPVTWGEVDVIGTYRAAQGALEVEEVRIAGAR